MKRFIAPLVLGGVLLFLLIFAFLTSCGPVCKKTPHEVEMCQKIIDGDCEDACVTKTSLNIDKCREECVQKVCK